MSQPWWVNLPNQSQRDRYRVQVANMIAAMNAEKRNVDRGIQIVPHPDTGDDGQAEFLYARSRLIVRSGAVAAVLAELRKLDPGPFPTETLVQDAPTGSGLTLVHLPTSMSTGAALVFVTSQLGRGTATLDRVVHLATSSACPATEPAPVTDPAIVPRALDPTRSLRTPTVAIIDTGIWTNHGGVMVDLATWPWMRPGRITPEAENTQEAGTYRGHGLFVTGIVAALAPDANLVSHAFFGVSGGRIESDLVHDLLEALDASPKPDIISMSAGIALPGAQPVPDPAGTSMLGFEAVRAKLEGTGTVLVCAAGNDAGPGPFEPASLPWSRDYAVAVGALDQQGALAGYSNYGSWVDVYAQGSGVVNAFVNGAYRYAEPPLQGQPLVISNQRASWSGTSFATPTVAGLIAHRMRVRDVDARTATAQLLAIAQSHPSPSGLPVLTPADVLAP